MNQSFFTLSLGIGAMAIFGSYIGKDHALLGESLRIGVLDTFVAFVAGLIIFPACSAYGISPDSGPSLIFVTLPNVFNSMAGGRISVSYTHLDVYKRQVVTPYLAAFSLLIIILPSATASSNELLTFSAPGIVLKS